jgi:predicted dehydrogenase
MTLPRLAIAGAGYWGSNLIRVCAEMGVLESVCEPDASTRARVAQTYPELALDETFEAALARDIDAVVIATPASTHARMALRAIARGKHVFVEKPLALSAEDASEVVSAAERESRVLCVGHLVLYHPGVQAMRDAIRAGAIGAVRHVRSRRLSFGKLRSEEDVVWSFAPHDVALMLSIFDAMPLAARSSVSSFIRPGVGDFAYADLEFDEGRSGHVEVSWLDPGKSSRLDVFGESGVLTFNDARDGAVLTLEECGDRIGAFGSPELWRGERHAIAIPGIEPLRKELEDFVDAVGSGGRPLSDGEIGLRVVRVLSMLSPNIMRNVKEEVAI